MRHAIEFVCACLVLWHAGHAEGFVGAFWLGVDAKVDTKVKVDQRTLDTINALPVRLRQQAVIAVNEAFNRLDETVKTNVALLSAEVESVSLHAATQWECTGKNVIDKFFSEIRSMLPKWNIFADKCEQEYSPDKLGPGPMEKVKIADCWVYDAMPPSPSPEIVATKLSTLELMAVDAACRLRETQSGPEMWKNAASYGLRFAAWSGLEGSCKSPRDCFAHKEQAVRRLIETSDPRDVAGMRERIESSRRSANSDGCAVRCLEAAIVDLYSAEAEVGRNRRTRDSDAIVIAEEASSIVSSARSSGQLSSTVGSEAWNSRDLKSRPH